MAVPADSHVHSEWSWDAELGSMEQSCAQAQRLGLPAIAFTEHLDHTAFSVSEQTLEQVGEDNPLAGFSDDEGRVVLPPFDVEAYLECLERCRAAYPGLRVLSGLEVGEPHWHAEQVAAVLARGSFDRVLGSLHCLPVGDRFYEPFDLHAVREPADVLRDYLAEVARLVTQSDAFAVLAHIDYPLRYWPDDRPCDLASFEADFRHALGALAGSGRALELNTVLPLHETILRWWRDEGGRSITFGSDAHEPGEVAHGFADASALAEACGFRPSQNLVDPWPRG